jgi:hypothetical protein
MSDVVVLSVARDESSAREFVHKLTAHHSQTESDANSDAIPFELRTKYYSVTLRLRCHDDELTSAITTTPLFGFANLDALRSELDALIVLIHA